MFLRIQQRDRRHRTFKQKKVDLVQRGLRSRRRSPIRSISTTRSAGLRAARRRRCYERIVQRRGAALSERDARSTPADVLAFWRDAGPEKWFTKDDAFDAEIRDALPRDP